MVVLGAINFLCSLSLSLSLVCVCVCERERERHWFLEVTGSWIWQMKDTVLKVKPKDQGKAAILTCDLPISYQNI